MFRNCNKNLFSYLDNFGLFWGEILRTVTKTGVIQDLTSINKSEIKKSHSFKHCTALITAKLKKTFLATIHH